LIEILLATTLSVMLAAAALTYLDGARHLGARIEFKSDLLQTTRAVFGILERDLQAAYASGQAYDLGFRGTDSILGEYPTDTLELVAANHNPKDETKKEFDLTQTVYRIDPDRGLVREKHKHLSGARATVGNDADTICAQVVGLDLRYHDGTTWAMSWDSTISGKLPKAVEIALTVRAKYHEAEEIEKFTSAFWLPVGQTYEAPQK
jgi:type II secretory pathway component PulJ